ncbi:MAG TPA: hypothetical protein VKU88_11715 [Acidimicrobiales bacterium]|nr:hypothetical protein [Acidimicrobiales bacterium]
MTNEPAPEQAAAPSRRRARLRSLLPQDLDLRNTAPIMAGAILLPLGVAVIVLGWNGAAHGRVDQQQIPYIISGGILGLAGVMVGCFFYWAHWLYRIYDQADLHHQQALREQREMMRELLETLGSRVRPEAASAGRSPNGAGRTFVATRSGTNFHTAGCPMVANRVGELRVVGEEEARGMKACRVCEPLAHANN